MGRKMVTVVTPQILQVVKKEVPETILQPLQVIMRGGQVMIPQLQAVKREILVTIPQLQVVKREILVMIPQSQAVKKEVQVMVLLPIQMDQIRVGSITAPHLLQVGIRSEEHTSELQSRGHLVCRLMLEKKNKKEL